jgi:hypothetical protein
MRDELREKIASLIKGHTISMWRGLTSPEELSDQILALIAPELEKANFLDNITRRTNDKTCFEGGRCPLYGECYSELWCRGIKKALNRPDEVEP